MRYDVVIIGGSYAGLAAALQLGRARRTVLVVDAGQRRNAAAIAAHGYPTRDGEDPAAIVAMARRELGRYPTVELIDDVALAAVSTGEGFSVATVRHGDLAARRLVLATGIRDELPDIAGLAERWGRGVVHCPYCHAFESADRPLGVIGERAASAEMAAVVCDWGPTTYFTQGAFEPEPAIAALLGQRGVAIEREPIVELLGPSPHLDAVRLADGWIVPVDLAFLMPPTAIASPIAAGLGCAIDNDLTGQVLRVDPDHRTTVPGVFAAGDASTVGSSIALAVATGAGAGIGVHHSLVLDRAKGGTDVVP